MSSAKITLFSFAKWMHSNGSDLFSEMTLPSGIDKNVLTKNILLHGGEFEVMYSDPNFMQYAIGSWSRKWYRTFQKWIDALSIEYNPIENYDRKEDWTDTGNRGVKTSGRKDTGNTRTFDNEDKRTIDTTETDEKQVSAYDSSSYQPAEKTTIDNGGTDTMNYSGTITDEYGEGTSGQVTENNKDVHDGRIHGNIGTLTTQEMLTSELELAQWNIYEHMTDLFLSEFVIPIYS